MKTLMKVKLGSSLDNPNRAQIRGKIRGFCTRVTFREDKRGFVQEKIPLGVVAVSW